MKVTPWEVSGTIDYKKLITKFGLQHMKGLPKTFQENVLFRRGLIFAHRDFPQILDTIKNKKRFAMMTGLMPSGKFHFGHKMVADQIVFYQKLGAKIYLTVADVEAYNSRNANLKELHKTAIEEYLTNYVALGLDLKKCDFYFQSQRSKDGKKASAYYSLANMLGRHVTYNEFKSIYGEVSPGKLSASLLQAADMLHPQLMEFEKPLPVVVPVGADQDPHLRLARDLSKRIKLHKFKTLSSTYHKFMPGLKGGKMSSSDENSYIALSEKPEDVAKKIKKYAFSGGRATLEEHRKKGGNPDVDVAYQMLLYGMEPDDQKLQTIYDDYKSGKLLSGELKNILIEKMTSFLKEHQKKRIKAKKVVAKFINE
ncbi:tryptophan--tRNA ligase [Candidatus Woesearchaeota archaeon]|jgi:tryptophanyl-tRNA synthetase|nr:tryptophan--tRNA ligase [Candidatus Woesearchaeota archaeon]MBT4150815.1 tryptophan--tRNA ligase [Candidatus Woesearchaeota archaeon]MBT4246920.1 tryptophan--tRNA ligase [Candidatus Woesearchaeota archaeon]MBT4433605.1 tryptophan--tRNA ligase [Candidatus Woesearchaeota archaeon]MBT7331787.1 tryptophan--tRNA ligase [Candidatus Woesearchaeota archaeon]